MKQILLVMMLFIFFPQVVHSEICEDYATKAQWASITSPSRSESILSIGHNWPWHYLGLSDGTMDIVDLQNPQQPEIINNYELPCRFFWMTVEGNLALGCDYSGNLATLDLSDPLNLVVRDTLVISEYAKNPVLTGNRAWVKTSNNEILILDTTLGAGLEVLGAWPYENYFYSMLEHDGLAYIIIDSDLFIMDFSDPETPEQVGYYLDFGFNIDFAGDILVVSSNNLISTYEVSDPAGLELLDTMITLENNFHLSCSDSLVIAYSTSDGSLNMFSLSDSGIIGEMMTLLAAYDSEGRVFFTDEHLYSCTSYNLNVIALGDGSITPELASQGAPGNMNDMVINEGYAFATAEEHGLCVFDISNPSDPFIAGSGFTPYIPSVIAYEDDLVVLAGSPGLSVFDISNPTLPVLTGHINSLLSFYPGYIALHNKTAWLGGRSNPAIVVDFSDAFNPVHIFTSDIYAERMTIDQGLLHAVDSDGLYTIYSLETMPPLEIGQIQLETHCADLDVEEDRVLICHESNGLSFLDISDPTNPVLLDHILIIGGVYDVSFHGDQVIASSYEVANIFFIDENQELQSDGTIWKGGWEHNILADGEILIRAARWSNVSRIFTMLPFSMLYAHCCTRSDICW